MKVLARDFTLEFETIDPPIRCYTAALEEVPEGPSKLKSTNRTAAVSALDNGKFELVVTITVSIDGTPVEVSNCSPEAQPIRWRAKTPSELIALSANHFRPSTLDLVRNVVYDAEDALKKDLDL